MNETPSPHFPRELFTFCKQFEGRENGRGRSLRYPMKVRAFMDFDSVCVCFCKAVSVRGEKLVGVCRSRGCHYGSCYC